MKSDDKIATPESGAGWTRPDAYIGALARKRTFRKAREDPPRTQPVSPQPWLSTIPFAVILAILAILAAAIIMIAFPGRQPAPNSRQVAAHEQGVAPRGWFQEAQKQFRN